MLVHDYASALEELFDVTYDIVFFVKDALGRYVMVNQTMVERLNLTSKRDLLGRTSADLYPAPLGQSYLEQDLYVIQTGQKIINKLEHQLYLNGESGWCVTNKVPLYEPNGELAGLLGISKDVPIGKPYSSNLDRFAESVEYLHQNYHLPLRVEELATMADLSVFQYEKRMRVIFQLTPGQYITRTRFEAAARMLTETDKPIVSIALECGYYDQSAFTRQFRLNTGITPLQFRAIMRRPAPTADGEGRRRARAGE